MAVNDDFNYNYRSPYDIPINGCFVVLYVISNSNKTIRIFDYPIPVGQARDLLKIPSVSESDIRNSLLKGARRNKILAGEIKVICSDIDLLQFNDTHKAFLQSSGVVNGLEVDIEQGFYIRKLDIMLNGSVDDVNTVFTVPEIYFINDTDHPILVYKNGIKQRIFDDFTVSESVPGAGYDTITMTVPPQTTPTPVDIMTADYYIRNS